MTHNEFIERLKTLIREWNSKDFADDSGREDGCIECANELQYYLDQFLSTKPLTAQETIEKNGMTVEPHDPEEAYRKFAENLRSEYLEAFKEFEEAGYKKEMHGNTLVFTKSIAPELDISGLKSTKKIRVPAWESDEPKPKRKWHKWSDIKDRFFSKKKQAEMKEQAKKELERGRFRALADKEDEAGCISVGGLAVECGLYKKKEVCPDCEGEGIVVSYGYEPDPTKVCPRCKGTGYKEKKDEQAPLR